MLNGYVIILTMRKKGVIIIDKNAYVCYNYVCARREA